MNDPNPDRRRNLRRAAVLLAIVLALLLLFRLCKHETEEKPAPAPTRQQTTALKAIPQHTDKAAHPATQGKSAPHARRGRTEKRPKARHQHEPAKRKASETCTASGDKDTADIGKAEGAPAERPAQSTPERQDERQPEQPTEPELEPQAELPTAQDEPAAEAHKPKAAHKPMKRLAVKYKGHTQSRIGIRAGAGYATVANLGAMVEDGNIRPRYTLQEHGGAVPAIGAFVLIRRDRLGIELAADYTWLAATLQEHRLAGDIHEETAFRYHIIIPQVAARLYLLADLYMGAGVGLAMPLNPGGIDFASDRPAMFAATDELTQAHLRETLRARMQAMPLVKVGYSSFKNGIEACLQYGYGLTDLIKTNDNAYGYRTARNNSHLFLLTVGYTIPLNKKKQP